MSTVRLKRLTADAASLGDYVRRHPRLRLVTMDGDPPERYQLEFLVKSLRMKDDDLKMVKRHLVEINLPRNYPRTPPQCRMLTPVFHPNIAPHAICVGDHWSAGESLESIVIRIGEMLSYQVYNVKSPLNGDAARWVEGHEHELPLDRVSMLVEDPPPKRPRTKAQSSKKTRARSKPRTKEPTEVRSKARTESRTGAGTESTPKRRVSSRGMEPQRSPAPPSAPSGAEGSDSDDRITAKCSNCSQKHRVPARLEGRKIRCQICGTAFAIRASDD